MVHRIQSYISGALDMQFLWSLKFTGSHYTLKQLQLRLDLTGICFTELGNSISNEYESVPSSGEMWDEHTVGFQEC